jgi:hypothetical protein
MHFCMPTTHRSDVSVTQPYPYSDLVLASSSSGFSTNVHAAPGFIYVALHLLSAYSYYPNKMLATTLKDSTIDAIVVKNLLSMYVLFPRNVVS